MVRVATELGLRVRVTAELGLRIGLGLRIDLLN